MLEAALDLASRGFFCFPCAPGSKRPACTNGHKDATIDPEQIRRWWTDRPDCNIGVAPDRSGHFVLDQDGPIGAETLAALELEHGFLPETLTVQTPRGNGHLHYWFKGKCPSTVAKLGTKLDTRGYDGYVLVPPSRTEDGEYVTTTQTEIAPGPQWIADRLRSSGEGERASGAAPDLAVNVDRARSYLGRAEPAIEGSGGDDRTYQVCAATIGFGLSPQKAFELIRDEWNPHCIPPWSEEELAVKVRNAAEYAQNEPGAWAVAPCAETFAHIVPPETTPAKVSRFYPYKLTDTEAFREPEWLIPQLIPKRGTVQITGKQKSFKTFLTLEIALGLAAGVEVFGHKPEPVPVVYIAGENAAAMALKHVPAWRLAHRQEQDFEFRIVQNMPLVRQIEDVTELVQQVRQAHIKPGLVVLDTATRALRGLDENSAKDMGLFSAACEMIQRELDCTVIVIRHTGKDESRGGRGSNVIDGDFDTILDVERHEKSLFVKLSVREQRNAAERERPYAFEGSMVGPSLAFVEIPESQYRQATAKADPLERSKVGAKLRELGTEVTTEVLATELTGQLQGEAGEDRDANVRRTAKALRARSRGFLAGYCRGDGNGLRWFIAPALLADDNAA